MGKKKNVRRKGDTVEYKRGVTVSILTWNGTVWLDNKGRSYTESTILGHPVYHLEKAQFVTSQVLLGICDKNPKHQLHTDHMPRSKKCGCGGTYTIDTDTGGTDAKIK